MCNFDNGVKSIINDHEYLINNDKSNTCHKIKLRISFFGGYSHLFVFMDQIYTAQKYLKKT